VLITVSLIGIIVIQISWLKNVLLLREDQVEQRVEDAGKLAAQDLAQYKGNLTVPQSNKPLFDEFPFEFNTRPNLVANRFTTVELHDKIKAIFKANKLEDVPFEFALYTFSGEEMTPQRRSANFRAEMLADSSNYFFKNYGLVSPSGSATENLSSDEFLVIVVPSIKKIVRRDLTPWIVVSVLFTLIIFTAFFLTVRTMLRQKKVSEIKNDFINNMTHEFKTPIATISLAVDALKNEKVQKDPQKLGYFSSIIKEENQRMNRQVETILKSALMDRQEVQLNNKPLHVHQIINDVVDNFILRLQEKQGALETELNAQNDLIEGDEVHINNLINNLLDNAVKYSKENVPPRIHLSTNSNNKKLIIRIEDNGIGMTRETVKRIFEKFYRAHTGNIHNVKGFGLGLSYVKTVVEAHDGNIKADSTLGKGSCFIIELPLRKEA
jgi:two-component system, OmpR family, phosphate regulon sensor histidine kinase PhoR